MKKDTPKRPPVIGKPILRRVRITILDGTGSKDTYAAKITAYDLTPADVIEPIRQLVTQIRDKKMGEKNG